MKSKKTQKRDKKNILIFSLHYEPYIGGAEVFVKELVSRSDHNYTIITRKGPRNLASFEKKANVKIYRVGKGRYDKYIYPVLAYKKALRLHKKKRFDIVYSVMANHAGLAGMWFRKKTHVPFILNLQMGQSDKKIKRYTGPLYKLYKKIYLSADKIHAISNFLKYRAIKIGVDPKKIEVIPNGVDLKKFNRKRFKKSDINEKKKELGLLGKKIIITSSRLSKKNGIGYVIKAMRLLRDKYTVFLIVGEGELESELKEMARRFHLEDRVKFIGHVKHDDLPIYLCMSDVFIRPSLSEGQGISFIEAMACKVPVVATPVGGIPDFIEDGKTGFFCKVSDARSIAKALKNVFEKKQTKVIEGAVKLVKRKYLWDNSIREIDKICNTVRVQAR
jgi:glycosyltransferase involved in cell wall biosynthesis